MHIESMHEELHIGYNIFLFSPSLFRNAAHSLVVSIRDEQNIWKVRKTSVIDRVHRLVPTFSGLFFSFVIC